MGDAGEDDHAGGYTRDPEERERAYLAANVLVRSGTDDEPSLAIARDRNGLTLQGAQNGCRSQDDEALSVRHDGVRSRWAATFGRLDMSAEALWRAREEGQAGACADLGSKPPPLELAQLRYPVRTPGSMPRRRSASRRSATACRTSAPSPQRANVAVSRRSSHTGPRWTTCSLSDRGSLRTTSR